MSRILPIVILLVLGMLGCKSVKPSEMVGTWVVNDASRAVLPIDLQKSTTKVVLEANGAFSASDVPGLFFFPGIRDSRTESGSGVWKLVSREGKEQVQLDFHAIADWTATDLPYGTQLEVSRGWSGVSLFYFLGDPDDRRRIELAKQP